MHATLQFWSSAYSLKGHEQIGPLIRTVPGREWCFRSNASHQPQKRVSACDPVIDEDLNGALWKRKAREEMPPISQPLFSNKCRTKWLLNAIEALPRWLCVCVCMCVCNCATVYAGAWVFIHECMCVCMSTVIAASMHMFIWECMHDCVCEAIKLACNNLLMGAYSIRDTYTTQPDDNANTDPSSCSFYSKMAWFLGKLNGALADGLYILVEFFFP